MISRVLTGVALTGMLLATGCGGGTGSSSINPLPNGGGTNSVPVPTSAGRGSVSVSVLVPRPRAHGSTTGSSRSPQYVSPGSSGISVFLGGTTAATALTAGATVFALGSAGSPSVIPANPQAFGPATVPLNLTGACASSGCSVSYSYAAAAAAGYYNLTLNFSGLVNGFTGGYNIGVVVQDLAHNGYVLSEGQVTALAPPVAGPTGSTLTLKPVVAAGYLCDATCTGLTGGVIPATAPYLANTFVMGAYVADELGYTIPDQGAASIDNGSFAIKECDNGSATTGSTCLTASPAIVTVTACNPTATVAFGTQNILNPIVPAASCTTLTAGNATGITRPGTLNTTLAVPGASGPPTILPLTVAAALGFTSGISVALNCATAGTTKVALVSTAFTPTAVNGFTYSASNYPIGGGIVAGAPGAPTRGNAVTVNCSPGLGLTIN